MKKARIWSIQVKVPHIKVLKDFSKCTLFPPLCQMLTESGLMPLRQSKRWLLIPDGGVSVSVSMPSNVSTVVISPSGSGVCVCVWDSCECVSVGRGSVGSLPRPDTAADAKGFTLLSNPPLWCSRERLPGRELTLSPLPRRGSRFWGRAEGRISPFGETSRPFWVSTDCSKPPADALELFTFGLPSFVFTGVTTGDWVEGAAVGTSLSEKIGKQEK